MKIKTFFLLLAVLSCMFGCSENSSNKLSTPSDLYLPIDNHEGYYLSIRVVDEKPQQYEIALKISNNTTGQFPNNQALTVIKSLSLYLKDKDGFMIQELNIGIPLISANSAQSIDQLYKINKKKYEKIKSVDMVLNITEG